MKKKAIYFYYEKNNTNSVKIGKADQRDGQETIEEIVRNRVKEQLNASTHGEYDIYRFWDISDAESSIEIESLIHEKLELAGYTREKRKLIGEREGTSEWFLTQGDSFDDICGVVSKAISSRLGQSGQPSYKERGYQRYIKEKIVTDIVDNNCKVIGCELSPRFGKTVWALDLFNTLSAQGYQYMILPCYVLTAHSSFKKEINCFSDFSDFIFIEDKDPNFVEKISSNKDKKLVIGVSLHTPEDSRSKYDAIASLDSLKKIAFIDEADFGAHTSNSKEIIDALDISTKIIMTGTAIERAIAGYKVDSIHKWSYMDMLLLKNGNHPILDTYFKQDERERAISSCADIVMPNLYKLSLPNAPELQDKMPGILQASWHKLLIDVEKNADTLRLLMRALFVKDNSNIVEMTSVNLSGVAPANVTMIFGGFENKKQHNTFVSYLQSWLGNDFVVVTINGDETTNREAEMKAKKIVAESKKLGKRVVLVAKDMASRSFSVSEIDTVFLMYDRGLVSQTVQKVSRAFTPGVTYLNAIKTHGTIVSLSFDNNRNEIDPVDMYIADEAYRISSEDESLQDSIKRICNAVNIFQNDFTIHDKVKVDADEYATGLLNQSSIMKDLIGSVDISIDNLQAFIDKDLIFAARKPIKTGSITSNVTVDISKVRTTLQTDSTPRDAKETDEEQEDLKSIIESIIYFGQNVVSIVAIDGFDNIGDIDATVASIKSKKLEQFVEDEYGMKFAAIEMIVDNNIIPKKLLNTVISNIDPDLI